MGVGVKGGAARSCYFHAFGDVLQLFCETLLFMFICVFLFLFLFSFLASCYGEENE